MDLSKRKGFIRISRQAYDSLIKDSEIESPFNHFYPSDIRYEVITDTFVMYGYSRLFKELQEYEIVPEYTFTIIRKPYYKYEYEANLKDQ